MKKSSKHELFLLSARIETLSDAHELYQLNHTFHAVTVQEMSTAESRIRIFKKIVEDTVDTLNRGPGWALLMGDNAFMYHSTAWIVPPSCHLYKFMPEHTKNEKGDFVTCGPLLLVKDTGTNYGAFTVEELGALVKVLDNDR